MMVLLVLLALDKYISLSRFTIALVFISVIKSGIIMVGSYFLVIEIVTDCPYVVYVACVILFVGSCGSGAQFSMFNVTCHLFECRLYFVNLLLQQLLFDEPPNDSHIVISKVYGLLPIEFNNVRWYNDVYEQTDKMATTITTTTAMTTTIAAGTKKKSLQCNNPTEPTMARHDINSMYQITKIWPIAESTTINVHKNAKNIEISTSSYNPKTFLPYRWYM